MYPVRILSLNNGWQILNRDKFQEWQDIQASLLDLTPELATKPTVILGNEYARDEFNVTHLATIYDNIIHKRNWRTARVDISKGIATGMEMTNFKNKVSVRLLSSEVMPVKDFNSYLLADAPRLFRSNICDVFVILIPADNMGNILTVNNESVLQRLYTEKTCRSQIEELKPISIKAPFLIVFFSYLSENIEVGELEISDENVIERSLEFAPEYTQAGISVLSYFGEVLRQKYPGLDAKVRIEQRGTTVLMHVELPSGEIDTVREELATYFLVAAGKEKPETLLSNPLHVMALENKLQIANMELRMSHQLNAHLTNEIGSLKISQQRMEETFKAQIAEQGTQIRTLINLAAQQSASHERVHLAQIGYSSTVFQGLAHEAQGNQVVLMAVRSLEHNLMSGIALIDIQDQLNASLMTIKQEKPSLFAHLAGQVESAGFGAAGGFVLDWISKHT